MDVALSDLWIAVLVSGVVVFLASSVLHMLLPLHRGDYKKMPGEESVLSTMRDEGVTRGQYMFPCPGSMKEMGNPEMVEKFRQGPVGYAVIGPSGPPAMGKSLGLWFLYTLVVGFLVAYIISHSGLNRASEYMAVFRLASSVAFMAYGVGCVVDSIWKSVSWCTTLKFVFDGLIYALLTAGVFSWLWPEAL